MVKLYFQQALDSASLVPSEWPQELKKCLSISVRYVGYSAKIYYSKRHNTVPTIEGPATLHKVPVSEERMTNTKPGQDCLVLSMFLI